MKKLIVLSLFAATTMLLVQCSPKPSKSIATTNEPSAEEKVADVKKNYSEDQLAQGKSIFEANCGKCHKLIMPEKRNVAQWEGILPRMAKKARLDDQQAAMVRAWVLTGAKLS